ncbi:MAG: ABC transporter permease [Acidobacteriota bacterium]
MLRHAYKALRRTPGYTAACIAVLALAIGANTAIFGLVYSAILKPLPYPDVDRLVLLWQGFPGMPMFLADHMPSNRLTMEEWKKQATSYSDVGVFHETRFYEGGTEKARVVPTEYVSVNLLSMLGAQARRGRLFRPDEETPGADRVAVLTDGYFERRFHNDPDAIGKTLTLSGTDYTVIGVLSSQFRMPAVWSGSRSYPDVFVPLSRGWTVPGTEKFTVLNVAAKLKPGVTIEQAGTELSAITTRLHDSDKELFPLEKAHVFTFAQENQSEDLNGALYLLLGAVGFVLLIGCANLANLTLARATMRAREIAVRRALGASRGQIIGYLLTESFLVSLAGTAAALILAQWIAQGLLAVAPSGEVPPGMGELNLPVFVFAAAICVLTTLLFGLMPAMVASRASVNVALKSGDRAASARRAHSRQWLTIAEVAMALVLLTGAGLLVRSFSNIVRTSIGFEVENLAVADIALPENTYPDAQKRARVLENLVQQARAIPGVKAAGLADSLPLHRFTATGFQIAGRPKAESKDLTMADVANISPEYLSVMGLPLRGGRGITAADAARNAGKGDGVVLINQAFVDKYFPGVDPLGQRLLLEDGKRAFAIVGVVGNFRWMGAEEDIHPQFFRAGINSNESTLVLRTSVPPESLADDVRKVLGSIDEGLMTTKVETMAGYVKGSQELKLFGVIVLSIFAGVALVLAMVGVYSVLTNLVASRTREIGIRMALGASPAGIGRMVAAQSFRPIVIGMLVGLGVSLGLSRLIESMLFQVKPHDPLTLGLAATAILLAAPLAIWIPVRRATRVECTVVLREE